MLSLTTASLSFAAPSRVSTPQMVASVGSKPSILSKPKPAAADDFCFGLPGNIAPTGNFDPANLLAERTKGEVFRYREAELTHGRVAMLASLGFLVQEFWHPLFSSINQPAINQIPSLPPALWFGMTLGIGIAESLRIQKGWANPYELDKEGRLSNIQGLKPDYVPGDLAFDPLGLAPSDPAEFRKMQERELSHGRLAMFAAAGFLAQEAVTGKTWGQQDLILENKILGPFFEAASVEVARDALAKDLIPSLVDKAVF